MTAYAPDRHAHRHLEFRVCPMCGRPIEDATLRVCPTCGWELALAPTAEQVALPLGRVGVHAAVAKADQPPADRIVELQHRPILLTRDDWIAIDSALHSTALSLECGTSGSQDAPGSVKKQIRHLTRIRATIGPDGGTAAAHGVAPAPNPIVR